MKPISRRGGGMDGPLSASHGPRKYALCVKVLDRIGGSCPSALGIDLASMKSDEVFKWLLVSILLGTGGREAVAFRAYRGLEKAGLTSPARLLTTNWQSLVDILDQSGYIRHNFKIAIGLPGVVATLNSDYEGDLNRLHFFARDEGDLERRLQGLGKTMRPATVTLFLRGLRELWEKANPPLRREALIAFQGLRLLDATNTTVALEELRILWDENGEDQSRFSDLEAALMRLGRDYCRTRRCHVCPVKEECRNGA